jgi:hypothetical protein
MTIAVIANAFYKGVLHLWRYGQRMSKAADVVGNDMLLLQLLLKDEK